MSGLRVLGCTGNDMCTATEQHVSFCPLNPSSVAQRGNRKGGQIEPLKSVEAPLPTTAAPVEECEALPDLLPVESMALTVALVQTLRGDVADPNVSTVCILALARLAGRHDWTEGER